MASPQFLKAIFALENCAKAKTTLFTKAKLSYTDLSLRCGRPWKAPAAEGCRNKTKYDKCHALKLQNFDNNQNQTIIFVILFLNNFDGKYDDGDMCKFLLKCFSSTALLQWF